jgi:hypothetical protein
MKFSVTKNGLTLSPSKYLWDEKTKVFSTNENGLVIGFSGINGCTFKTGLDCVFTTGSDCTFSTESDCTFDTGPYCVFNTGFGCIFKTGLGCTFDAEYDCTFDTGSDCAFNTGSDCTFKTEYNCEFSTGWGCTFKTEYNCVIARRDIFEVYQTEPEKGFNIRLNGYGVPGFTEIKEAVEMTIEEIQNALGKKIKIVEHTNSKDF